MADLIDRQAAIDGVINLWADKPFGNPALVEIKDVIEALPSAEHEIVRCKDCEHYWASAELCTKWTRHCGGMGYCDEAEIGD